MGISDIFKKAAKKLDEGKDPVCGMKVDLGTTKFKSIYQGKAGKSPFSCFPCFRSDDLALGTYHWHR